ncbi:MAG: hypothetical protein V1739_08210 [Candidatus Omnitrophota bacterium]
MKKYSILILLVILNLVFPKALLLAQEKAAAPEHSYNKGIDFYNKLDYNKAIENFLKAFNTENKKFEQWINYNLGNAAFETGQKAQGSNPQAAQQAYKQALEFFRRAIELNVHDKDAKHNYELTALKLEQAKQEQQKKEQQDKPDQKEQQDKPAGQDKKPLQQEAQPQEMTEKQAKMLLENFQNSEGRPTELRMLNSDVQDSGVEKDW